MTPRRLKSLVLVAGIIVSGLTIIAWSGIWFTLDLDVSDSAASSVAVSGETAAGGLAALGLAGLALIGALSIAGPVFRVILGVLEFLIGGTVALSAFTAIANPVAASAPSITAATGVSGSSSIAQLVNSSNSTGWPVIAAILGVATAGIGVAILVTSRRWPRATTKYQTARFVPADDSAQRNDVEELEPIRDRATSWDALSDGADPTSVRSAHDLDSKTEPPTSETPPGRPSGAT